MSFFENALSMSLVSFGPLNSLLAISEALWFQEEKCLQNISSRGRVTMLSIVVEGRNRAKVSWRAMAGVEEDAKV